MYGALRTENVLTKDFCSVIVIEFLLCVVASTCLRCNRISFPPTIHKKILEFATHIDCVSRSEEPKPTSTVLKTMRVVMGLYNDENFREYLEREGGNTLSIIQKCVRKEIGIEDKK